MTFKIRQNVFPIAALPRSSPLEAPMTLPRSPSRLGREHSPLAPSILVALPPSMFTRTVPIGDCGTAEFIEVHRR